MMTMIMFKTHTLFTCDDNKNYYDNIDFDSLTEIKKRVYEVEGHEHSDV